MTPLERLEAAVNAWLAAPVGSDEEWAAADEMAGAGLAVLAAAKPLIREAA